MPNITHLPFIADTGKGKNKTRTFWRVTPNGVYTDECIIGEQYAYLAIEYMAEKNFFPLLVWIMKDIQQHDTESGIEVGFISMISEYAIYGLKQAKIKRGES